MDTQSEGAQGEGSGRAKSWTGAELPVDEASKRRRGACVMWNVDVARFYAGSTQRTFSLSDRIISSETDILGRTID